MVSLGWDGVNSHLLDGQARLWRVWPLFERKNGNARRAERKEDSVTRQTSARACPCVLPGWQTSLLCCFWKERERSPLQIRLIPSVHKGATPSLHARMQKVIGRELHLSSSSRLEPHAHKSCRGKNLCDAVSPLNIKDEFKNLGINEN